MEDIKNIANSEGTLNADVPLRTEDADAEVVQHAQQPSQQPSQQPPAATNAPSASPTQMQNEEDMQTYDDMVHDKYVDMRNTKVYNALMIISFMLDNGIDLDEQMINNVREARESVNTSKWNDVECKFLKTYSELVKSIYPVSIEMLSNPSKIDKVELSGTILGKAERDRRKKKSVMAYSIITGFFVLLLLGVQVFYYLGSTRLSKIASTQAELETTLKRYNELIVLTTSSPDNLTYSLELEDNRSKSDELNQTLQSNILLLEPWTKKLSSITFNTRLNKDIDTKAKENKNINIEVIQEAKGYALILGIYILPLLYGLIGGLTYILREMRSDVRKYTLDKESTIKYILRIILGSVAGLSVGLFWSDIENAQAVGFTSISLSPMLLAFIAGYCVEHVLGFIDKVVQNVFNNLMSKSKHDDDDKPSKSVEPSTSTPTPGNGKTAAKPSASTSKTAAAAPLQPTKLSAFAERI
jgi:hypothetical protein